jgi:hypothetical protein
VYDGVVHWRYTAVALWVGDGADRRIDVKECIEMIRVETDLRSAPTVDQAAAYRSSRAGRAERAAASPPPDGRTRSGGGR